MNLLFFSSGCNKNKMSCMWGIIVFLFVLFGGFLYGQTSFSTSWNYTGSGSTAPSANTGFSYGYKSTVGCVGKNVSGKYEVTGGTVYGTCSSGKSKVIVHVSKSGYTAGAGTLYIYRYTGSTWPTGSSGTLNIGSVIATVSVGYSDSEVELNSIASGTKIIMAFIPNFGTNKIVNPTSDRGYITWECKASCTAPTSVTLSPSSTSICSGTTTNASILFTGGSCSGGTWYYRLDEGSYTTSSTRSGLSGGTHYAYVRCNSEPTCATKSSNVTINTITPSVIISGSTSICEGGHTMLSASGSDSYTWSPPTGLSSTSGMLVTASPSETQTYTVTGTKSGCTATNTVTVIVTKAPVITSDPEETITVCQNEEVTLSATATGATSLIWQESNTTGSGFTDMSGKTSNTLNPSTATAGTKYYRLKASNDCDFVAYSDEAVVIVKEKPTVTINGENPYNKTICNGDSEVLTASGAETYTWSPATGLSAITGAEVKASPTSPQTYTVTGTTDGCSSTAIANITVNNLPVITTQPKDITGPVDSADAKLSVVATASGVLSYQWEVSTDGGSSWLTVGTNDDEYALPVFTKAMNGNKYRVKVTANGCTTISDEVLLTVYSTGIELELAKGVNNVTSCVGDTIIFTLTITNTNDVDVNNIMLSDTLPNSVKFLEAYGTVNDNLVRGKMDYTNHIVYFNAPLMPKTQHTATFTIKTLAMHNHTGNFINKAGLDAKDMDEPIKASVNFSIKEGE